MRFSEIKDFYGGKRVFVTGHTGFKGSWLCKILNMAGAEVYGYSLEPPSSPNAYSLMGIESLVHSVTADVRDFEKLNSCIEEVAPEYVFHLAAQPIVRESYKFPRETFETNIMGTVNLLESIRLHSGIKSVLNVTTDKVYENKDAADYAFPEDDKLDGFDPYSNSKSCSELVTHSYKNSFFNLLGFPRVSTARAGNVIGGGDFASDRIIPDCVRACKDDRPVMIRNPYSTRPYQHVLEPLGIYLTIVMRQEMSPELAGYYNVGPDEEDCVTTGELADLFVKYWGGSAKWVNMAEKNAPHEAGFLKLDCAKLKRTFGWKPVWHIEDTVKKTVEWYKTWHQEGDLVKLTERQIYDFFE